MNILSKALLWLAGRGDLISDGMGAFVPVPTGGATQVFMTDGMDGLPVELRADLLDVVIEPGAKTAPFQDMGPDDVAEAFNEAKA